MPSSIGGTRTDETWPVWCKRRSLEDKQSMTRRRALLGFWWGSLSTGFCVAASLAAPLAYDSATQPTLPGEPVQSLAIVGANVVPMDRQGVLQDQTVLIEGGVIVRVGARDTVEVPSAAHVLDGRGLFVLPGFADMHAHVWPAAELDVLLASGVTLAREMFGYRVHLSLRADVEAGRRAGPRLIVATPIFEGTPPAGHAEVILTKDRIIVDDRKTAAQAVAREIARGYDLVKVYNNLNTETYLAIVSASRERGVPVVGHVPFDVGLRGVLKAGQQTIEHLRGYVSLAVSPTAPDQPGPDYRSRLVAWRHADPAVLRRLAEETARAGTWNVPTLVTMLTLLPSDRIHELTDRPGWKACMRGSRADPVSNRRRVPYFAVMSDEDFRATQQGVRVQKQLVRMLHEAGARLLVGTDTSPVGYSFHWELEEMVDAGIPAWDVLRAATRSAAEYLGKDESFGTVTPGKRADLVMLRGNPLEDIRRTGAIDALYWRGRLIRAAELEAMRASACDLLNQGG